VSDGSALIGGLTWAELAANRRVRRLRRGKHFRGDLRTVQREAYAAAAEMGCVARVVRDDFRKTAYVWVQFVDLQLPLGEPCPSCGGREMVRTHEHFGRCSTCQAGLAFLPRVESAEQGVEAPPRAKMDRKRERLMRSRLDQFTNVQVVFDPEASDEEQEVWYGRGEYHDELVLLRIMYPLRDGARQPHPDDPDDELHHLRFWSLAPYGRAVELGLDIAG
jgi:hypothetical protein